MVTCLLWTVSSRELKGVSLLTSDDGVVIQFRNRVYEAYLGNVSEISDEW